MSIPDPLGETANRDILSVSQLNRKSRQLLETHLPLLWVEGEISNFASPSSGHWYFTLKDSRAQVRCAMFRNRNTLVRFKPDQGHQVVVRARVSVYEARGDYQLIVEHMEEAGFGVLQRAFEALKAKLQNEGLFDSDHKQPLPTLPKHLAVITSPTGAAIRDVLSVLGRRFPGIPVTIIPVPVQGEGAAQQIVAALELANQLERFDVILLTRGGGSLEDLWPFNEEIVARAIYASQLPVVSAVGHEVDVTISDFVADARAPTPSAAAELLSPDSEEWWQTFASFEQLLARELERTIAHGRDRVHGLAARLRHPGERIQARAQHLDNLEMRLRKAMHFQLHSARNRYQTLVLRQHHLNPQRQIQQLRNQLQQAAKRGRLSMEQVLRTEKRRLAQTVELLDTVSPLSTLKRGYSVLLNEGGEIVRHSGQTAPGDTVTAKLGQGELLCRVEATQPDYESLAVPFRQDIDN